jgi:Tfp pilus assembly protein PilF
VEAARQTFGDLKRFAERIESYARQSAFYAVRLKSSVQTNDKGYESRPLPAGESLALRGDFHMHMGRITEARAMLEEALQQDPNLAAAHEGLGNYYFRQHDVENAGKELQRATELNSKSYLTYYFAAMLNLQQPGGTPENWGGAEASLEKAIALNPNFAPAYANLASLYSMRREAQEKALSAARRASELEPGTIAYSVTLGYVLMNMNRNDEARALAARLVAAANTPAEISSAKAFQENVETRLRFQAQFPAPADTQMDESESGLAVKNEADGKGMRATEPTNIRTAAAVNHGDVPRADTTIARKPAVAEPVTSGRIYEMTGKITVLDCSRAPEVTLTLNLGFITMKLHSADLNKIGAKGPARNAKTPAAVCAMWKGRSAKMSYHLTPGQAFDGELTSVHFF